jgi:hypothetical protein
MSLNHIIDGGIIPPLNCRVNDLAINGDIQTSVFQSETFNPQITVTSDGIGASLISNVSATAIRMRNQHSVTYRCNFDSGTGSSKCTIYFQPPVWITNVSSIQDLKCVLNCTHKRNDDEWESLINQGCETEGVFTQTLIANVGKEDNTNFPVTKEFQLNITFTFSYPPP